MSILIIENNEARTAGTLSGRVLIGRWPDNTIVIDDRAVSRVHAWIGVENGEYYISDASSRTGTMVNGMPLRARHVLGDGDEIRIGPARIRFQTDALPADVAEIDLTPKSAAALSSESGELMECACGAPLWLPHGHDGKARCRYCGHSVRRLKKNLQAKTPPEIKPPREDPKEMELPTVELAEIAPPRVAPLQVAPPRVEPLQIEPPELESAEIDAPEPEPREAKPPIILRLDAERICGICHSPMTAFDQVVACGSCSLPFHSECWEENHGCSAYGCDQVGVLDRRNAG